MGSPDAVFTIDYYINRLFSSAKLAFEISTTWQSLLFVKRALHIGWSVGRS